MLLGAQLLRLSGGDEVAVVPFRLPPVDGFGIALLSVELEYVQKRRSPTQTDLDASTLAKHILSRYVGQVSGLSAALNSPNAHDCRVSAPAVISHLAHSSDHCTT